MHFINDPFEVVGQGAYEHGVDEAEIVEDVVADEAGPFPLKYS
jgi:hypothetical protein